MEVLTEYIFSCIISNGNMNIKTEQALRGIYTYWVRLQLCPSICFCQCSPSIKCHFSRSGSVIFYAHVI